MFSIYPPVNLFASESIIRVGVFEFDPLCRTSSLNQNGGLFLEILQYVASKEKWSIRYSIGTLQECKTLLEKREIDLIPAIAYSYDKETLFYFTRETVFSTWAQVYTRNRNILQSIINLDKQTVGVVRDDPHNPELRKIAKGFNIQVTFVEFTSAPKVFQALAEKWVDAGVVDRIYGVQHEASVDVKQTPIIFSPVDLRYATARNGRHDLIDTLDYHLTRLKNNQNSIYYLNLNQILGKNKNTGIPNFILWFLAIVFGLLLLFVSSSLLLHRQVETKTKELSQKNMELENEIQERERTEEALMESEEKFRLISEESLMAIAILQGDKFKYANKALSIMAEYPLETVLNWNIEEYSQLLHPDDRNFILDQSRKKQQGAPNTVNHYSFRFFSKSGKLKWIEQYSRTILYKGGFACLLTASEITETMETKEKLAAEKEWLSITLRSIGDGVITTDKDGNILLFNRMAETITGWKQEEVQGEKVHNVFQVKDEKTGQICENPVQKAIETGTIVETAREYILIARHNSEHFILSTCAPILDKNQQTSGAVLVFHDITEKHKMELEIQKALKLESLGILAAGIAHDFNNLLAIIMGNIGLAKRFLDPKDQVYNILNDAEKGASNATGLSQQLLTFARGNSPVKEAASIQEIIEDSARFALRGSAVRCDTTFNPALFAVNIDKNQISQVFQNLIINAEQAMPCGGIISIHARNMNNTNRQFPFLSPGNFIEITIKDQGVGIPQEYLDKVFDPFFTTKQKGNGLGLSVVYSIIKKHDGYIRVESQLGKGTIFYIYLPASPHEIIHPTISQTNILTGSGNILVMDDNEAILEMLGAILEEFGYNASLARHGEEALELYQKAIQKNTPYAAVIMDLTIAGGMGGKETLSRLKAIDPAVKAIVSSGYANDPVIGNYKEFGFKGVINKPFKVSQLSKVLHQIISQEEGFSHEGGSV